MSPCKFIKIKIFACTNYIKFLKMQVFKTRLKVVMLLAFLTSAGSLFYKVNEATEKVSRNAFNCLQIIFKAK